MACALALTDGSHLTLNTDTGMRTAVGTAGRALWFDRGEAYMSSAASWPAARSMPRATSSCCGFATPRGMFRQPTGLVLDRGAGRPVAARPARVDPDHRMHDGRTLVLRVVQAYEAATP